MGRGKIIILYNDIPKKEFVKGIVRHALDSQDYSLDCYNNEIRFAEGINGEVNDLRLVIVCDDFEIPLERIKREYGDTQKINGAEVVIGEWGTIGYESSNKKLSRLVRELI